MANQNKGKCETFILRGNADSIIRQLVDEYNSSNGWSVNRMTIETVILPISPPRSTFWTLQPSTHYLSPL